MEGRSLERLNGEAEICQPTWLVFLALKSWGTVDHLWEVFKLYPSSDPTQTTRIRTFGWFQSSTRWAPLPWRKGKEKAGWATDSHVQRKIQSTGCPDRSRCSMPHLSQRPGPASHLPGQLLCTGSAPKLISLRALALQRSVLYRAVIFNMQKVSCSDPGKQNGNVGTLPVQGL